MNGQELKDKLFAKVDEDKHAELSAKLDAANDRADVLAIIKSYGIDVAYFENKSLLEDSYELTDQELEDVAGGTEMPWDNEICTNCCA